MNQTYAKLHALDIINSLNFASNCTIALTWLDAHNPASYWYNGTCTVAEGTKTCKPDEFFFGNYRNTTVDTDFLQAALSPVYINDSDTMDIIQGEMSSQWAAGATFNSTEKSKPQYSLNITWYEHAL
ncbi:hypothetical protein BDZ45DRAFT_287876 [Acephala macrosclerotiorum]|nr:hypothetical protein BDZ45DRAFT_287876 [Acephala macrosclerotiorum]